MKHRAIGFSFILAALVCIATATSMELAFTFMLNNSSLLNGKLLEVFRNYCMAKDRKIIQFLSDCAIYDTELAYTLKPGNCPIKNREFEVTYSINSKGMRDNESSLMGPEIIVSGDSHAMGWVVEEGLTFSNLLEKKLEKSVLNAAISSYGTVRELKILNRVNLSNLKYLIIQYSGNDFGENKAFAENGNFLPIMSEKEYASIKKSLNAKHTYFFGRHSYHMLRELIKEVRKKMNPASTRPKVVDKTRKATEERVEVFLNSILNSAVNLKDVVIIVFEVNGFARNDSLFIDKLNEKLKLEYPTHPIFKNIIAVDYSVFLRKDKYFHLDDHINRFGHQAIAENLTKLISGIRNNIKFGVKFGVINLGSLLDLILSCESSPPMAESWRLEYEGALYHVTAWVNGR